MSDLPISDPPFAYENPEFLNSADGRLFRIMAEYQEPMARFRRERIQDTVVFFGSARFRALDVATSDLQLLENTGFGEAGSRAGAASPARRARERRCFRTQAAPGRGSGGDGGVLRGRSAGLAGLLARWAKSLPGRRHRFVVTSGGGPGIMEAANRGAFEAGCKSIGLNIRLPFEQQPNPYITPELSFTFHYFFMRKFWFAYLAKALVIFPGGFGTLDEMFELLTLAQTQKLAKQITVVIYGSTYWKSVLNLEAMADRGAIALKDLDLFRFADTPEEAFAILRDGLTQHHMPAGRSAEHPEGADGESVPPHPAPSVQEMLGPDIARHTVARPPQRLRSPTYTAKGGSVTVRNGMAPIPWSERMTVRRNDPRRCSFWRSSTSDR